jgi:hypothetical protein
MKRKIKIITEEMEEILNEDKSKKAVQQLEQELEQLLLDKEWDNITFYNMYNKQLMLDR